MKNTSPEKASPPDTASTTSNVAERVTEISSLLRSLDETAANSGRARSKFQTQENKLAQVRLGMASSLFMALRCKHAPTAGHSMRVALGCSAWTLAMDLPSEERDQIEVAALLHDVGKIGVPDHILQKPGKLTADETVIMEHHRKLGMEILSCCCAPQGLLDVISHAPAWYDGRSRDWKLAGKKLPLGARIISIVDAFDAMTTDHVYRRAMPRERALAELFDYAGKQFDPDLVRLFVELHEQNQIDLHAKVSQRWLETLAPDLTNGQWRLSTPTVNSSQIMVQTLFQQKLLDNMHDGVVFVDRQLKIFLWNHGVERLSGIAANAVYQRTWTPELVQLRDDRGRVIQDKDCPVARALETGMQSIQRLSIAGRNNADMPIDLHAIPVLGRDGVSYGATLMIHDVSSETTLEECCESLHSQATKDPLTQVANRAEFDRVHELFIQAHTESHLPCSLIIADIDHFKNVNDNFGHQAGDEAIKTFAALLKSMSRHGDLVARYGGEEFVLLCADCNVASAFARSEQIRRALHDLPLPLLGNKHVSASFGVTENQPGDTPATMLRRADRALLQAKATGRNRTVQLGTGGSGQPERRRQRWWPFQTTFSTDALLEADLATNVPLEVVVEKLRGFVADHDAHIVRTEESMLELSIEAAWLSLLRRNSDRQIPVNVELHFSKITPSSKTRGAAPHGTRIHVAIRPKRNRDRRQEQTLERARGLLSSLKSYLMAHEVEAEDEDVLSRAKKAVAPWLKKKS